jgi:hypothetical protein
VDLLHWNVMHFGVAEFVGHTCCAVWRFVLRAYAAARSRRAFWRRSVAALIMKASRPHPVVARRRGRELSSACGLAGGDTCLASFPPFAVEDALVQLAVGTLRLVRRPQFDCELSFLLMVYSD